MRRDRYLFARTTARVLVAITIGFAVWEAIGGHTVDPAASWGWAAGAMAFLIATTDA